jgi:2-succinyl-5-enolpyruvyl-6-hydroxy-3-cyclohexene-1-carboxylate synthase
MQNENINIFWSYLLVEELIRNRIDYFCISPGSRSTPLTAAAARHPKAQKKLFYDERAAAYHALGYARATGKAAVLICTSGTAAANYYPAVIEAHNDRIPLIVLSADRPPELLETQANQTINQYNLYGNYVNWHFTLPVPAEDILAQMTLTTIDLMISKAMGVKKGPVHLNCMFREPLEPKNVNISAAYINSVESWRQLGKPYTKYHSATIKTDDTAINEVKTTIEKSDRGLLILGRLPLGIEIEKLIQKLRWPVFADITCGCRHLDNPYMIQNFDHLLFDKNFKPHTILHLGAQFASKRLLKLMPEIKPKNYILIEESGERIDAEHIVTMRIRANVSYFAKDLAGRLSSDNKNSAWFETVKGKEIRVRNVISDLLEQQKVLTEAEIARIVSREILPENGLFLSNSMPIRDMNSFAQPNKALRYAGANRGVSGIDGIIASASGFAEGLERSTVLIIGDLAFLHDMNSLHLVKNNKYPLIIILLNNHGGGIFHFLPVAQHNAIFKDYFLTPHNYTFKNAARQFGLSYKSVEKKEEFLKAFTEAQQAKEARIIEVKTDSNINYQTHSLLNKTLQDLFKNS